jgi:outer membrane protein assembly factor BamB
VTHSGRSELRGPRTVPREIWAADTKAYRPVPAIGADDTVYVPAADDGILAFSPDGGLRKLAFGGGDVTNTPAIGRSGTLYFGAGSFAVALAPDAQAKRVDLRDAADSSPAIDLDGNVYTASYAQKLVSFDAAGNFRWEVATGGAINSSPAIGPNGDIYIGSFDHLLYAVVKDGTRHWDYDAGAEIRSSPVVADDGTVYIGTMGNALHAVGADGMKKWTWAAPGPFDWQMLPALGWDGTIYAATLTKLVALRPDGTTLWTFDAEQSLRTPVVVDVDGVIYVGGDPGRLWAISPSGRQLWTLDVGDPPTGFAIGRDRTLYVSCDESDRIHVFRE